MNIEELKNSAIAGGSIEALAAAIEVGGRLCLSGAAVGSGLEQGLVQAIERSILVNLERVGATTTAGLLEPGGSIGALATAVGVGRRLCLSGVTVGSSLGQALGAALERLGRVKLELVAAIHRIKRTRDRDFPPVQGDISECMVCFEERPLVILAPCVHKHLCEQCSQRLVSSVKSECPLCKASVPTYVEEAFEH